MSVRAYIVKEIKIGGEIFNLWHDKYFVELIERLGKFEQLDMDGCGIMSISKDDLKEIEEMIAEDVAENSVQKEEVERAKEIVEDIKEEIKKQKTDCVDFYCF